MAAIEGNSDPVTIDAQASASFDEPNAGADTTVSSDVLTVPVEGSVPESAPISSVDESIERTIPNFVAAPETAPVSPTNTNPDLQFIDPTAEGVAGTGGIGFEAANSNLIAAANPIVAPASQLVSNLAPLSADLTPVSEQAVPTGPTGTAEPANQGAASGNAADEMFPLASVGLASSPTFSATALPAGSRMTLPVSADSALQFTETLNLAGVGGGQDVNVVTLPSTLAQLSGADAKTEKTFNDPTKVGSAATASSAPAVARAGGAQGLQASAEDALAAYVNGGQPKDFTLQEQANLIGRGVPAAELGLSPDQAKVLPAVRDPSAAELSPTSLALQDFQKNAGGEVSNLGNTQQADTRSIVDPNGSVAAAAADNMDLKPDKNTTLASASLNPKGLVDLSGGPTPGADAVALAGGADGVNNLVKMITEFGKAKTAIEFEQLKVKVAKEDTFPKMAQQFNDPNTKGVWVQNAKYQPSDKNDGRIVNAFTVPNPPFVVNNNDPRTPPESINPPDYSVTNTFVRNPLYHDKFKQEQVTTGTPLPGVSLSQFISSNWNEKSIPEGLPNGGDRQKANDWNTWRMMTGGTAWQVSGDNTDRVKVDPTFTDKSIRQTDPSTGGVVVRNQGDPVLNYANTYLKYGTAYRDPTTGERLVPLSGSIQSNADAGRVGDRILDGAYANGGEKEYLQRVAEFRTAAASANNYSWGEGMKSGFAYIDESMGTARGRESLRQRLGEKDYNALNAALEKNRSDDLQTAYNGAPKGGVLARMAYGGGPRALGKPSEQ